MDENSKVDPDAKVTQRDVVQRALAMARKAMAREGIDFDALTYVERKLVEIGANAGFEAVMKEAHEYMQSKKGI